MNPGDVVLVTFPFSELSSTKKRPALVLRHTRHTSRIQLVTVAMITSKLEGLALEGDVHLKEWESAKLLHPSLVRLSKIATIDHHLADHVLGKLAARDLVETKRVLRQLYRFWLSAT